MTDLYQIDTLAALFDWRVRHTPDAEAYLEFDTAAQDWRSHTWEQIASERDAWIRAIRTLGLPPGARVATLLPNGTTAVIADQAALALGFVPVPIHVKDRPESLAYILADSGASLLVVATIGLWEAIVQTGQSLPDLKAVVVAGKAPVRSDSDIAVVQADAWLSRAANTADDRAHAAGYPASDAAAAIVYTSGTTGRPKGAVLTHANVMANLRAVTERIEFRPDDMFLSFLPLSHALERTVGYYLPIAAGSTVAFARSTASLPDDLRTIRPTVLVSVPRIYEKFHAQLLERTKQSGGMAGLFLDLAIAGGWQRFCARQGIDHETTLRSFAGRALWRCLDRKVARPVRDLFGGRLRMAITGGAAMPRPVAECFLALGVPILQGYGMTEATLVVSVNSPDDNRPWTVGRAMGGLQARIRGNSELQVRGPSVMKGYWNRPEDTRAAISEGGWLHTGDQAVIDDGRITITGRIKEIIVTSTGEKVPPVDLESAIMVDSLFDQAFVTGERRPFISAIVVLNPEAWRQVARDIGRDPEDKASLRDEKACALALERIKAASRAFPYYAVPRAVTLTLTPWTVDNALITTTLKLRRSALSAHFGTDIERMYAVRPGAAG